jgi:hypothetical protein
MAVPHSGQVPLVLPNTDNGTNTDNGIAPSKLARGGCDVIDT